MNRKGVLLLHDNARPHLARITKNTIIRLGYERLVDPHYFPHLSPTDYHLFRGLEMIPLLTKHISCTGIFQHRTENSIASIFMTFYHDGKCAVGSAYFSK